jgi:hypothetical protein
VPGHENYTSVDWTAMRTSTLTEPV